MRHNEQRTRPARLIGVVGTNTDIGKTWVTAQLIRDLRSRGLRVAARKPVQSFAPGTGPTDAEQLAAASGEGPEDICPAHRRYPLALAPPMAADLLNRGRIQLADLLNEIIWPANVDFGFVETVGGARSPLAHNGDSLDLIRQIPADEALLIADAALGTINSVRLTVDALQPMPVTVMLNRYDAGSELHRLNRQWLSEQCGLHVIVDVASWMDPRPGR